MTEPTWPLLRANGYLYGSYQRELQSPLILEGSFDQEIRLQLRGGKVSSRMGGGCLQSRVADLPEYLQP